MTSQPSADLSHRLLEQGSPSAPVLFTCEHASQALPPGWTWPEEDAWIVDTHWAYDLGAAELSEELARALRAPALLAAFSRLLADPNRPEHSEELFRQKAEGRLVHLNRAIDEEERQRRLEGYYRRYHQALDALVARSSAELLFSVHTFTPVYEGQVREVELGVLFDREEAWAEKLAKVLTRAGFRVGLNEPYSGKEGLSYSVDRHAWTHSRRSLEIEVRQDLAVDAVKRAAIVEALMEFFVTL